MHKHRRFLERSNQSFPAKCVQTRRFEPVQTGLNQISREMCRRCWWTLICALQLVLSFLTLVRRCWWTLTCALPLVLSFLTLVSRCWRTLACALPLVLSFLTLASRCWWTLTCALPLVLSFSHWSVAVGGLWLVRFHSSCLF